MINKNCGTMIVWSTEEFFLSIDLEEEYNSDECDCIRDQLYGMYLEENNMLIPYTTFEEKVKAFIYIMKVGYNNFFKLKI